MEECDGGGVGQEQQFPAKISGWNFCPNCKSTKIECVGETSGPSAYWCGACGASWCHGLSTGVEELKLPKITADQQEKEKQAAIPIRDYGQIAVSSFLIMIFYFVQPKPLWLWLTIVFLSFGMLIHGMLKLDRSKW